MSKFVDNCKHLVCLLKDQRLSAVLFFGLLVSHSTFALPLSPQDVVDIALRQAPTVKKAELKAQADEGSSEKSLGSYDLIWKLNPSYTYSEAQNLSGTANPVDKTMFFSTSLGKAFSTGTALSLQYTRTKQESELSTFTSSLRSPRAASDVLTLSLRQALWRNIFGASDRAAIDIADNGLKMARLNRQELLENAILESLSLYWQAYVAETELKENTSARGKYEQLVKAVRRKAGYNLSSPGELPRLEAEFSGVDSRVKLSSQAYLAALDKLRTNLQIDPSEKIQFKTSVTKIDDLPVIPSLKAVDIETLRPMVTAKYNMENAENVRTMALQSVKPQLNLVASAATTGVDKDVDGSFTKMTAATSPTYVVGLEFELPLDSSLFRGTKAEALAKYGMAKYDYKLARDQFRDALIEVERGAHALRDTAVAMMNVVTKRAQVVKEFEVSYRQGRTPLVELIRAYNELFDAQLTRAKSIGNYMDALNRWAAIRDELVRGEGGGR